VVGFKNGVRYLIGSIQESAVAFSLSTGLYQDVVWSLFCTVFGILQLRWTSNLQYKQAPGWCVIHGSSFKTSTIAGLLFVGHLILPNFLVTFTIYFNINE